jgi:cell division septal protein FtsQ
MMFDPPVAPPERRNSGRALAFVGLLGFTIAFVGGWLGLVWLLR